MERWLPVKDYEDLYEISDFGNLRSLDKVIFDSRGFSYIKKGKAMTPGLSKGYYITILSKNKKRKTVLIHKLVAEVFVDNPNNLPQVNHKDEIKINNYYMNLEWVTSEYNINYGTRTIKASITQSKPVLQFNLQGDLVKEWCSAAEAGRNGFTQGGVSQVCRGIGNTFMGYKWEYKI